MMSLPLQTISFSIWIPFLLLLLGSQMLILVFIWQNALVPAAVVMILMMFLFGWSRDP
jgi:hypothetical protein